MDKSNFEKMKPISYDTDLDEILRSSIRKRIKELHRTGADPVEIFDIIKAEFEGKRNIESKILREILFYDQNVFHQIPANTLNRYIFDDPVSDDIASSKQTSAAENIEEISLELVEGNELYVTHKTHERNGELPKMKKHISLEKTGSLKCEICEFDFYEKYGEHGKGFMECHHIYPVSKMEKGAKTKIDDLALVCANCHRMIHRSKNKWLSLDEIKSIYNSN